MADQKRLYYLLPSPAGRQLLMLRDGEEWSLPLHDAPVPNEAGFESPEPFNAWFKARFGAEVFMSHSIEREESEFAVFVLQNRQSEWVPPDNGCWVDRATLEGLHLSEPALSPILTAWFDNTIPSRTMPWLRPGQLDDAIAWMTDHVTALGMRVTGPVAQIKNAYVSCVLRCPTDKGSVYMKILPGIFIRELAVTRLLNDWNITPLPELLATDEDRGWMLMRDMGGCDLKEIADIDVWEAVMEEVAAFQLRSVKYVDRQPNSPLYDWRVPVMREAVHSVVDGIPRLLGGSPYALDDVALDALRAAIPRWQALCDKVQDCVIPDAIDHGDLRAGNVRITHDSIIFYDWAWSAVTHPFLAPTCFLNCHRHWLATMPGATERLRDAYLNAWTDYVSIERLQHVFGLVDELKILYGAVGDAAWVRDVQRALNGQQPVPHSADAWTLDRRQFYWTKMLRRLG